MVIGLFCVLFDCGNGFGVDVFELIDVVLECVGYVIIDFDMM